LEHGILRHSGSFLTFGEARLGQGRAGAKTFLEENPAIASEVEATIRSALATPKNVTQMQRQLAA
jgi:recombination protein RecA